jgi:hypothetical protein
MGLMTQSIFTGFCSLPNTASKPSLLSLRFTIEILFPGITFRKISKRSNLKHIHAIISTANLSRLLHEWHRSTFGGLSALQAD